MPSNTKVSKPTATTAKAKGQTAPVHAQTAETESKSNLEAKLETEPDNVALPTFIHEWDTDQVTIWLKNIDLAEYIEIFQTHALQGEDIISITEAQLISIGINKLGHRNKILREAQKWEKNNVLSTEQNKLDNNKEAIPVAQEQLVITDETNDVEEKEITHKIQHTSLENKYLKHKKSIPLFNGDKSNIAAYRLFKAKFKHYLDYYSIPETQTHSILTDAMAGKAGLWLAGYTENHPEISKYNYDKLMTILDTEYLNPLVASKYQLQYDTMKPIFNESVPDLITRIDNLAIQAGKTIRTDKEKKIKLWSLLPYTIQPTLTFGLHDDSMPFEAFATVAGHVKEQNDIAYQNRQKGYQHERNKQSSINFINKTSQSSFNNNNRSLVQGKRDPCKYCSKPNHPTFLCSTLLHRCLQKDPAAMKYWQEHKLDEQSQKYHERKALTNTATNDNKEKKDVVSASNVNSSSDKSLIYVDGKLDNYPVHNILIDDGSMLSLITKRIYNELLIAFGRNLNQKLSIDNLPCLYQADGKTQLPVKGRLVLQLKFEDTIIGVFPFIIVETAEHDVIIGRDITQAANLSIINDNGTRIVQGLDNVQPNIKLGENVNIFRINNIIKRNIKLMVSNINSEIKCSDVQQEHNITLDSIKNIDLPEHMKSIIIGPLPEEYTMKIKHLLIEFQDVFHKEGDPINALNTHIKHRIRLKPNAQPIKCKIYPLPPAHHAAIKKQVNEWLLLGIVSPSFSPWSTPCLVVDKKDAKLGRVCGSFGRLNEVTENDAYPLKDIEEQKSHFVGSVIMSCLDFKDAYLQVVMDEESKEKTAIVTQEGLFQFNRMIFGLKTAPATFHRIIDDCFKDLISICLEPYFDDLTIHSKSDEEHLTHLRQVFTLMRKYGFKAKPTKVKIGLREIEWLGFIISKGTIRPDHKLVQAIKDLQRPTNLRELRMVTGLFNFYRSFIPNFADIAAPLDELKKAVNAYIWTDKHQRAFNTLQQALMQYPVLRLPDVKKPFTLDTDASTIGIGGILQQLDNITNALYVVSYFSRKLSEAEKKWSVTDLEALAMRDSIRKFHRYLVGKHFIVRVDHISLTYLKTLKTLTGKLGRINLDLQSYDFSIEYKPGRQHSHVDCLSRMPSPTITTETVETSESKTIANVNISSKADLTAFHQIQQADPFTVDLIEFVTHGKSSTLEKQEQITGYMDTNKHLTFLVEGNVLKVKDSRMKSDTYQIYIPDQNIHIQLQLAQLLHNPVHQGVDKLYKAMRQKFYWNNMKEYLTKFVDSCLICQKTKRNYHNDKIEKHIIINQEMDDPHSMCEPLSQITVDHLDLPLSNSGYTCLLVIVDRATRLVKAIPSYTHDTEEMVHNLIEHWIFTYGVPRAILSDRGGAFGSILMKELSKVLGIDHVLSSAYNPQSDGLVERVNQSIQKIMRAILMTHADADKNWDRYINHVVFVMNTTVNNSTGYTPYELVYGRKACYPIDRLLNDDEIFSSIGDYLKDLLHKQQVNYYIVHENLLTQRQKNELYNDQNSSKMRTYDVGDMVYKTKFRRNNKLEPLYEGPYLILKKINDLCYQIKLADNDKAPLLLVNIRHLKPFVDPNQDVRDATQARKTIDDVMREFHSVMQQRKPISKDDYMTDEDFDLMLNNE